MKNIKKYARFIVFISIVFTTAGLRAAAADAAGKADGDVKLVADAGPKAAKVADNTAAVAAAEARDAKYQGIISGICAEYMKFSPTEACNEIGGLSKRIKDLEENSKREDFDRNLKDAKSKLESLEKQSDKSKKPNPGILTRISGYLMSKISAPDFIQNRSAQIELYLMAAHIAMWILNEPASRLPIFSTLFSYTKNWPLSLIVLTNLVRCYNLRQKFNNDKLTFDDSMKNIGFMGGHVASVVLAYKAKNLTANYLGLTI